MFPCNFFHPVFRSARGTAGLTECPLPGILSCMKLWSGRGCAEQCVAKLDRAGLYKPKDLVRNTPLVCTLCHKPSLAWGSCHSVCPFKHSIHRVSHSGTQAVQRIFELSEKECLHFVTVPLRGFSSTLQSSDSLLPFQHAAFYH